MPDIPTMGPTAPILTYWGAVQWLLHGLDITKQGYGKVRCSPLAIGSQVLTMSLPVQGQGV